jgi:hypothetical protein
MSNGLRRHRFIVGGTLTIVWAQRFPGISFPITAKDGMNDDTAGLFDVKELVESVMPFGTTSLQTGRTEIIIWTVKTFVADSDDDFITNITDNTFMYW